jgi:FkbM family methyltransferase
MNRAVFIERLRGKIRRHLNRRKRPSSPTLQVVTYRGARFLVWVHEDVGWRLTTEKTYEPAELEILRQHVHPGDVCFDIGANIGIFTVLLARWAHDGHVHAFEPIEHSASVLRINLELNGIANATLHTSVLSDREGDVTFAVAKDGAYSSLRHTGRKSQKEVRTVASTRIDTFIASIGRSPDVMKIDVEGAELPVLQGAAGLLRSEQRPRAVLAEAHEPTCRPYGYTPADLVAFMKGVGYQAQAILPDGHVAEWPRPGALADILFVPAQN